MTNSLTRILTLTVFSVCISSQAWSQGPGSCSGAFDGATPDGDFSAFMKRLTTANVGVDDLPPLKSTTLGSAVVLEQPGSFYYLGEFQIPNLEKSSNGHYVAERIQLAMSSDADKIVVIPGHLTDQNSLPSRTLPPILGMLPIRAVGMHESLAWSFAFAESLINPEANLSNFYDRAYKLAQQYPANKSNARVMYDLAQKLKLNPVVNSGFPQMVANLRAGKPALAAFAAELTLIHLDAGAPKPMTISVARPLGIDDFKTAPKAMGTFVALNIFKIQSAGGLTREFILFYDITSGMVVPLRADDIEQSYVGSVSFDVNIKP